MKGLELSEKFYYELGAPMLRELFGEFESFIAVALTGSGSECYGFDDEISQDHDFEPGFSVFLPSEKLVDEKLFFEMEKAYNRLPREFMGFKRSLIKPVGGKRNGIFRTEEFFLSKTGSTDGRLSAEQWLTIPDYALAEATNGKVFCDNLGELSEIRERLKNMPRDIFLKRLAGNLLLMKQSGQYNFPRMLSRGDTAAAQLALYEFVKSAFKCIFLLKGEYLPYYKWQFAALRALGENNFADSLEFLISTDNSSENAKIKEAVIASLAEDITVTLKQNGITKATCLDLEKHAYSVNDFIQDGNLRNSNILIGA